MARIVVVGSGVVGRATGKGFLAKGHQVLFVDINPGIIERLRSEGYNAFFPPEVDWAAADIIMLSVNTPTVGGQIVLDHLLQAVETVARGLAAAPGYPVVVVRSTVVPTTTEQVVKPLLEEVSGRRVGVDLGLCMNPEFLRQVSAEEDFINPWITVVGSCSPIEAGVMHELYMPFGAPIVHTDCTTAETIKYANNLYNATKISFFNELFLVCERLGIDHAVVSRTVARSAEGMWNPYYGTIGGWPYGGACLPKDTAAFLAFADALGLEMPVLTGTMRMNQIMEQRAPAPASLHEVLGPAPARAERQLEPVADERFAYAGGARAVPLASVDTVLQGE